MKRPLNYAMLKYFTTVDEASVDDVRAALSDEYGTHSAFKKPKMIWTKCCRSSMLLQHVHSGQRTRTP